MSLKRILYVVSTLRGAGPTTQLLYLIKYLDRTKFEPVIVTLSPEPGVKPGIEPGARRGDEPGIESGAKLSSDGVLRPSAGQVSVPLREPSPVGLSSVAHQSRRQDFEELGVSISTLGLSRIRGLFAGKRMLSERLSEIKPDVIHTQGFRADVLLSRLDTGGIPWILTVHNDPFEDYLMKFGRIRGRWMAREHLAGMKRCKNVGACSETVASRLESHDVNPVAIQNGVELPIELAVESTMGSTVKPGARPFPKAHSAEPGETLPNALQGLFQKLPRPRFISAGSLIPLKNMGFLIRAFEEYSRTGSGSLIIVGEGHERKLLQRTTSSRVHFTGHVPNVHEYLAASDYYLSASLSEGLPNTVLEALAAGLPLLLSDIPSHREVERECLSVSGLAGHNNDDGIGEDGIDRYSGTDIETDSAVNDEVNRDAVNDTGSSACHLFNLDRGPAELAKKMGVAGALFPDDVASQARLAATDVFHASKMSGAYQQYYSRILESK